jgi:hypothetical protein
VRRGASVLADGFGPGAHPLSGTAQRFLGDGAAVMRKWRVASHRIVRTSEDLNV